MYAKDSDLPNPLARDPLCVANYLQQLKPADHTAWPQ